VLAQALARHGFEAPPSLVERRIETLLAGLDLRLPDGAERERALAELRARLQPQAEAQVRAEFLLDAIAARDGIAVTEAEVANEVDAIVARERQMAEQMRGLYKRPEARTALRARMMRDRALGGLVAAARVMPSAAGESVAHENQTR
jgi:FKBP-type peptidyl-prolyl cis-trans isomerase (trigger factor)